MTSMANHEMLGVKQTVSVISSSDCPSLRPLCESPIDSVIVGTPGPDPRPILHNPSWSHFDSNQPASTACVVKAVPSDNATTDPAAKVLEPPIWQ